MNVQGQAALTSKNLCSGMTWLGQMCNYLGSAVTHSVGDDPDVMLSTTMHGLESHRSM